MSVTTLETGAEVPNDSIAATPAPAAPPVESRRRKEERSWVFQVTGLSIVLGVMLALAIRTTAHIQKTGGVTTFRSASGQLLQTMLKANKEQQQTIQELTAKLNKLQEVSGSDQKMVQELKKQLADIKALAGLLPVEGPGLKITIRDSPVERLPDVPVEEYMVHDTDLNGVINELKAAGAEALALAGADPDNLQRVIATSAARCVGPAAVINDNRLAAPYHIYAIGNPKELRAALEMIEGIVKNRGLDTLKMIEIQEANHLVLPPYSGSISPRYAKPTKAPRE
jgi:uncharacterized protein YlxW (UPF0749 family)